jgi:hypothetical protein
MPRYILDTRAEEGTVERLGSQRCFLLRFDTWLGCLDWLHRNSRNGK